MRFVGSIQFQEFWDLLKDESPRGRVVVAGAYFDERLGAILGRKGTFDARIREAFLLGLLSANEKTDLNSIRTLRNSFAHDLRATTFDAAKSQIVESMQTWQIATSHLPQYRSLFATPEDRFLYIVGVLHVRLERRSATPHPVLPEPAFTDFGSWPAVTG